MPQGQHFGGRLAAQGADGLGWRPDPGQARVDHGLCKVGVLTQKTITRVHRIGTRVARRLQQVVDAQIGVG